MLHGAVVWLVAVPSLVALAALGAGSFFGGWYGSLVGVPVWATPNTAAADPAGATAARAPLLTVTALLTGLVGSVLGGWLASGEAASIYLYRTRTRAQRPQSVRQPA